MTNGPLLNLQGVQSSVTTKLCVDRRSSPIKGLRCFIEQEI